MNCLKLVESDAIATAELGQDVHEAIKSLISPVITGIAFVQRGLSTGGIIFIPPISLPYLSRHPHAAFKGTFSLFYYSAFFTACPVTGLTCCKSTKNFSFLQVFPCNNFRFFPNVKAISSVESMGGVTGGVREG